MTWCENNDVDFLLGLAKNSRLVGEIEAELAAARANSYDRAGTRNPSPKRSNAHEFRTG